MDKINTFKNDHREFIDILLDDIWLTERPIELEKIIACWEFAVRQKVEFVDTNNFEEVFKISFQEITDWINKNILGFYE